MANGDDFQLPEVGSTLPEGSPLREAAREASQLSSETLRRIEQRRRDAARGGDDTRVQQLDRMARQNQDASRSLQDLEESIGFRLNDAFLALAGGLEDAQATIQADLQAQQEQAQQDLAELDAELRGEIERSQQAAAGILEDSVGVILAQVDQVAGAAAASAREVSQAVAESVEANQREAEQAERETRETILEAIRESDRSAASALRSIQGALAGGLQAIQQEAEEVSQELTSELIGLAPSILLGLAELDSSLGGAITELGRILVEGAGDPFARAFGLDVAQQGEPAAEAAEDVLARLDPDSALALEEYRRLVSGTPTDSWYSLMMRILLAAAGGIGAIWTLAQERGERLAQEYRRNNPTALLPPADAIDAGLRGLWSDSRVLDTLRAQGYALEDAEDMFALRRVLPSPPQVQEWLRRGYLEEREARADLRAQGYVDEDAERVIDSRSNLIEAGTLLDWWLRGIVDDQVLDEGLSEQGYREADKERLREGAFRPPPLTDIIRMAVREVFSPEKRSALGLDENYPERFTELAAQQGLSEEWARDIWAAHWQLPSPLQAFEMLHRSELTDAELDAYLEAADFAPVWRAKLKAISYRPLTRVDLRRMYELGTLDRAQLIRGYLDLGYSQVNAERLADFAVTERRGARFARESIYRGLTAAQLRKAEKLGRLTREQVIQELVGRDYSAEAASIFLELDDG